MKIAPTPRRDGHELRRRQDHDDELDRELRGTFPADKGQLVGEQTAKIRDTALSQRLDLVSDS